MKILLPLTLSSFWLSVSAVLWGTFDQVPSYHQVSGKVRLLNTKTIRLEEFHWDGAGFAVYAYYYPPGEEATDSGGGEIIPVPGGGSDGRFALGTAYTGESLDIPLPDGVDACDIGTFTIWCQPATIFFNSVTLTRSVFENDGADPCTLPPENIEVPIMVPLPEFDNCKILDPALHLRWRVNRNESNIRFQLCGCLSSSPDVDQYMGFGVSGSDSATSMFGADPTITWVDTSSQPNAVDYHLSAYTQCVNGEGACPDSMDPGNCIDDATLIGGFRDDSQQCVTFTRPFTPADEGTCDRPLDPDNENQYIVWGVGGLGMTAFRHFLRAQASDGPVHLGRNSSDECGTTALSCTTCSPYEAQRIVALENTTFRAVIGPSGNERGYMSITGQAGWGIAWHINGKLVPELVVQRGSTYTFAVEGGNNADSLLVYHPFYLTSSITGGKLRGVSDEEVVYAGFNGDQPTATGRLCELTEGPSALASRTSCQNIEDYLSKLEESSGCSQGEPGTLTWTPDDSTPDTLYYQCATHFNLGWRITVQDAPPLETTTAMETTAETTTAMETTAETTTVGVNIPGDGGSRALLASTISVLILTVCSFVLTF